MRPLYASASERLAGLADRARDIRQHVQQGTVRLVDRELPRRARRLVETPLIARQFDKDVKDELCRVEDVRQLSGKAQAQLERVIGDKGFLPAWFLQRGADLRHTVALVDARDANGNAASGTGFLVGPRLLLTNAHVLDWSDDGGASLAEVVAHSTAMFGFEVDFGGQLRTTAQFKLDPQTLLLSSPWDELDYVLVALAPVSMDGGAKISDFGYNRLTAELGKVVEGEPVFIIQHPLGKFKQIVISDNRVVQRDDTLPYLVYEADTDLGSSGSPVFNRQWEVVALHHATEIGRDAQGAILNRQGARWTRDMGMEQVAFLSMNEGVRISQIVRSLENWRALVEPGKAPPLPGAACSEAGRRLLAEALATGQNGPPQALAKPTAARPAAVVRPTGPFPRPD